MLDRKILREKPESIAQALKARQNDLNISELIDLDKQWRESVNKVEQLKAKRNQVSQEIANKKKNQQSAEEDILAMRKVGEEIKKLTGELEELETSFNQAWLNIPNIPHASVPIGPDETANQEIRKWGEPPKLNFTANPHWVLGDKLKMFDAERAAKISGARFVVYTGIGARLERALIQFMLDVQTQENGYTEIFPPLLVNRETMIGTGQLPKLEEDMFKTKEEELFLIPTAEVPVTNLHSKEILKKEELPIKYTAYTPCFRREAGSYGKDTKGLVRQHQFNKVELVKIVAPENSYEELEKLVLDAEKILQKLGLHYRLVCLSTGDMSFASSKSYDLEVWHAGVARYWEVSSCSNFENFQARRANIRFKDEQGKINFCHTLNGSGLATSRLLPAIIENYQTPEGGIIIPEVLRPYLGEKKEITANGELI